MSKYLIVNRQAATRQGWIVIGVVAVVSALVGYLAGDLLNAHKAPVESTNRIRK